VTFYSEGLEVWGAPGLLERFAGMTSIEEIKNKIGSIQASTGHPHW
jgi:hypothetical protein